MIHPWFDYRKSMKENAQKHLEIIKKFMALDGRTERQRRIAAHEYWVLYSYLRFSFLECGIWKSFVITVYI